MAKREFRRLGDRGRIVASNLRPGWYADVFDTWRRATPLRCQTVTPTASFDTFVSGIRDMTCWRRRYALVFVATDIDLDRPAGAILKQDRGFVVVGEQVLGAS